MKNRVLASGVVLAGPGPFGSDFVVVYLGPRLPIGRDLLAEECEESEDDDPGDRSKCGGANGEEGIGSCSTKEAKEVGT
jgi:hypothetical protein